MPPLLCGMVPLLSAVGCVGVRYGGTTATASFLEDRRLAGGAVAFLAALRHAPAAVATTPSQTEYSTRKTVEQTIQPSCCGQRKPAGTSGTNACCSTRPDPAAWVAAARILNRQPSIVLSGRLLCPSRNTPGLAPAASVARCGSHEPSKPPVAPAASPQRVTERAAVGHAVTPPPTFCQAPAGCSLDDASLVPRAAPCGLCVQFCHLTI